MRRNTTQPEDATIRDATNFSGISDLIDIIDRLDEDLDRAEEENTKLNDRIEGLEALLTEKESFIRDLESQIEST